MFGLQLVNPPQTCALQKSDEQTPLEQVPEGQTTPQAPQLKGSFNRSSEHGPGVGVGVVSVPVGAVGVEMPVPVPVPLPVTVAVEMTVTVYRELALK